MEHGTKQTIAVAGPTGALGMRVVRSLVARGASVRALVRDGSNADAVARLASAGAEIVTLDLRNSNSVVRALTGVSCVVSTLSGLRDVIVDAQSSLLESAVAAGVPRFIPSDFSADLTRLLPGENRNFDLRRQFHQRLDRAAISATSILNGAFADMLTGDHSPFFDFQLNRVPYWGFADQRLDFTSMDNVGEFTAAAALDPSAPRYLRIAGAQVTAREMAQAASEVFGRKFEPFRLGSEAELAAKIPVVRASDLSSESTVFAPFQGMQYMHNMFTGRAHLEKLDNARYDGIKWTGLKEILGLCEAQTKRSSSAVTEGRS